MYAIRSYYVSRYASRPLAYEPGTRQVYSSPGIDVMARIIEVVSGQSFESFMRARVFAPLGMNDTDYRPSPEMRARTPARYRHVNGALAAVSPSWLLGERRFPAPAFGLYSTASDLGTLLQMMLNGVV